MLSTMESMEVGGLPMGMMDIILLERSEHSHVDVERTVSLVSAPQSLSGGAGTPRADLFFSSCSEGGQRQEECASAVPQPQNGRDHSSRKLQK